ncbi:LOG family protein [Puia dinghuensis]|uniref:Cytokinin riboside 5'-monophosphate phosphoribohydrolase n=1 Tax=Puia dinghuensis TaxID=1792502 RepID=A0A8J2UCT7_9BACT|nr:TIGR00730 family Rossman fold protein [Puia dinghuensis]GGA97900.1 cytokinin riboside 5'-monophosphate phosphoribohydrolase [Puia dinghuensis]
MKRIVVFCGSSLGAEKIYEEQAYLTGVTLARLNIGLVYGGARVGLMGAVADGALAEGGEVIGVLPRFLSGKEIGHEGLTDLIVVDTMHERKTKMHELSDGVITLPGGFGTMEELFEMLTWGQLGLHQKPVGLLNVNGFYDELLQLAQTMVDRGFLKETNQQMLLSTNTIEGLLEKMNNYQAPATGKWITKETT